MGDTKIEWTDKSWNPVTGCTKVSAGCKNCYAERVFPRAYGKDRKFTDVMIHPERLEQPLHWKKSRRIFVNSMSDLFHESLKPEFIADVFSVMVRADWHTFQVLTKRPKNMLSILRDIQALSGVRDNLPAHIWLGVSVEDQKTADERIPLLLATPAAVRFVSEEPSLGQINRKTFLVSGLLHWWIWGSESGPNARPAHPDWARAARDQCQAAGVPFFMKQIIEKGRKVPFEHWPKDLQVREFPAAGVGEKP